MKLQRLCTMVASLAIVVLASQVKAAEPDKNRVEQKSIELRDAPDAVQKTIDREMKGGKLVELIRATHNDHTWYRALVERGNNKMHHIFVDDNGKLIKTTDISADKVKPVEMRDLPAAVRRSVERMDKDHRVTHLAEVRRGDRTTYRGSVEGMGLVYWDEKGHEIDDQD